MIIGFLGLGKMGSRMVEKLLKDGHTVIVWNRSPDVVEDLKFKISNLKLSGILSSVDTVADFTKLSNKLHVFWLMLPAGDATESILNEVRKYVDKGDIIVDGGNSFYEDTQRHSEELSALGIEFLGIGVSGGIHAAENGFPLMVGGDKNAYDSITPILDSLAKPRGGHAYFGEGGVGHYVKMVHNAVEYGMMQAIGEGFGVLDKGPYAMDLGKVSDLWAKNTIVAGFLMDRARDALAKDKKLEKTGGFIEENGEAKWTIALAKKLHVPIQVIEDSLKFRQESQKNLAVQNSFAAKMVASLRHEFGGHKVKGK